MTEVRLHFDLITDLLSRLPVKSLLQFRSVSKPWCSLIDSPRFINLHLNKSLHTNSNLSLILHSAEPLCSLDFDPFQNLTPIPHPFLPGFAYVLCSCNGLLLLQGLQGITLLNPSTRKHFNIPFCNIDFPDPGSIVRNFLGLGFDPVTDDYKVIRVVEFTVGSESRVYSLKSKNWKRIKDFPYCFPILGMRGVPLEGGFHTIVRKNCNLDWPELLVSIDFATEDYKILPLPEISYEEEPVELSLEILGGKCLCLAVLSESSQEFWVMKEYGVGESWTKLLSTLRPPINKPFVIIHILAYSKCGKKILFTHNCKKFIWFDMKRNKFVNIPDRILPSLSVYATFVCVNSLVRLDGCM